MRQNAVPAPLVQCTLVDQRLHLLVVQYLHPVKRGRDRTPKRLNQGRAYTDWPRSLAQAIQMRQREVRWTLVAQAIGSSEVRSEVPLNARTVRRLCHR